MQFCQREQRIPRKIKKKAAEQTKEEEEENSLYNKWRKSEEKETVDRYVGKRLEEIPEEHRQIVEQVRQYGYGLGSGLPPFEEIMQFCQKEQRIPRDIHKKAAEQTKEEKEEHRRKVKIVGIFFLDKCRSESAVDKNRQHFREQQHYRHRPEQFRREQAGQNQIDDYRYQLCADAFKKTPYEIGKNLLPVH